MRRRLWIIVGLGVLAVVGFAIAVAVVLMTRERGSGSLDTDLQGVTVSTETTTPKPEPPPKPAGDRRCWRTFGADPRRSLARSDPALGLPRQKYVWTRGLESYIEFPPVYCDGDLYVNSFRGTTYALDAQTGKIRW